MSEFEIVDVTEGDRLITQKEAAARLGTNQAFIKRLLDTNLLPCIRFGRYARISVYALTEFIREHQGDDLQRVVEDKELRMREKGKVYVVSSATLRKERGAV
ncbi:MAG: helix-turn-helix domain-containing protein [Anaerovibrio sp.]|uniref:helix-turn-helix domain-containing protein n=1 Tax=Anaerovibrio sp. TaxID=1872532 RepID=UPI002E7A1EDB|nr:helix-turn-helix domain-containing protein [Anaerovibrio sp.]MEE1307133.1 helix-turn-helix domain-containing protein [Anaerovibrio sp.]